MPAAAVQARWSLLEKGAFSLDDVSALCAGMETLGGSVRYVLDTVGGLSGGPVCRRVYAFAVVRGQGYYGDGVPSNVPRFRRHRGRRTLRRHGGVVPRAKGARSGLSIGFERICSILLDQGWRCAGRKTASCAAVRCGRGFRGRAAKEQRRCAENTQ